MSFCSLQDLSSLTTGEAAHFIVDRSLDLRQTYKSYTRGALYKRPDLVQICSEVERVAHKLKMEFADGD